MNFATAAIELLIVSGNRAQLWGTGYVNGAPAGFRITAVDGSGSQRAGADAIRIELWDLTSGTVRYDTQPGALQDAAVVTPTDGGQIHVRSRQRSPHAFRSSAAARIGQRR